MCNILDIFFRRTTIYAYLESRIREYQISMRILLGNQNHPIFILQNFSMRLLIFLIVMPVCLQAQKLKPLSYYSSSPKVSAEAKAFYKKLPQYQRNKKLYTNNKDVEMALASITDSVLSENPQTRPFYFYLVNRNLYLMDGDVDELVKMKQYEIMRTQPGYFFQYMQDNPTEKKFYYNKWIETMKAHIDMHCEYSGTTIDSCMRGITNEVMTGIGSNYGHLASMAKDFMKKVYTSPNDRKPLLILKETNGKTLLIAVDQTIKARFHECRGCASTWKISEADMGKVEAVTHEYENPSCVNCTGGTHDHIIVFRLKYADKTSITFNYFDEKVTVGFTPFIR